MSKIISPKEFFGKQPGDDYVMIHWDELCSYYRMVAENSDRVQLEVMGDTSEGNPFLMLYVSSPENLAQIEKYRDISLRLADPRELSENQISNLADEGRVICFQSYGLHSNEVGGSQMVPLMLYELASSEDEKILKILDNVIFIISPCSEPDGEILYTDWYYKYLGTKYEGACSPYLRHNWCGHSNNRDALRESVVESKYLNDIIIRRFMPQFVQDHHHQATDMNRMSIAPYSDPICEYFSPLVHRETAIVGSYMAMALSDAGRRGVVSKDPFFNDFPISSFYGNATLHNIVGILTESADANIASPINIPLEKINGIAEPCAICPDPWLGGQWHLRDIVEQIYIASMSLLEYAAENRKFSLLNMAKKALAQTNRGLTEAIKGYIITPDRKDPSALTHLCELMINQRIEIFSLKNQVDKYPDGSIYIPLAQPNYAVAKVFLSSELYSKSLLKTLDNPTPRLVDTANLCMALCMGIEPEPIEYIIAAENTEAYKKPEIALKFPLSANENTSYSAANNALAAGKQLFRDEKGNFTENEGAKIHRSNIGLIKLSCTGNEEHGFTRNLLKTYDFDYRLLMDTEVRENNIPETIDTIIIAGEPSEDLFCGDDINPAVPPEYRHGFGKSGEAELEKFVKNGGTLIAWEKSIEYVNAVFGLGMKDKSQGCTRSQYTTGGSQLNAEAVDKDNPVLYGMPEKFTLTHSNGYIPDITESKDKIQVIARIAEKDILKSGVIRGEKLLFGTPCIMRSEYGNGEIILYTFNPEFRLQQDGTFKVLFNKLYRNA